MTQLISRAAFLVTLVVPVPIQSASDLPVKGEGPLNPLGLGSIADPIAVLYDRPVQPRMRRIRFLTSTTLGAQLSKDLLQLEPAIPGDAPKLSLERVAIEALARAWTSGMAFDTGIPGISKAQSALLANTRLSPRGYLKSQLIFGSFGVYRPLALLTGLSDDQGGVLPASEDLAQSMFADARETSGYEAGASSAGFISWLTDAVRTDAGRYATFTRRRTHVMTPARIAARGADYRHRASSEPPTGRRVRCRG